MSERVECAYCRRVVKPYPIVRNEICIGKICPGCGHIIKKSASKKEVTNDRNKD